MIEHVESYRNEGYLFIPGLFTAEEIKIAKSAIKNLPTDLPGVVFEKNKGSVRAINISDYANREPFNQLALSSRLIEFSKEALASDIYIYQFKINTKAAFSGESWKWHQDFIFWQIEDEMPHPRAISVVLFLDEITEFNGPLYLIPRSHLMGMLSAKSETISPDGWRQNFSENLKYQVPNDIIADIVEREGILAPKGKPGSVLFLHPNTVHASPQNISPFPRDVMILTYNSIQNKPLDRNRASYIVNRDETAISRNIYP